MNSNTLKLEQDLVNTLIKALNYAFGSTTPSEKEARLKAEQLAQPFGFSGNLDPVVNRAISAIDTRMGSGISLTQQAPDHDSDWVNKRTEIDWTYSKAYF